LRLFCYKNWNFESTDEHSEKYKRAVPLAANADHRAHGEIRNTNRLSGSFSREAIREGEMSTIRRGIELTVRIGDEPTEMSAVGILAWHTDVEVLAMRSYCDRNGVVLLLITTNPRKASRVLEAAGFRCKSNPVLLVGPLHRCAMAAPIGAELAVLGIEVLYSYACRIEAGHQYLVFKTTEDDRALQALEASASIRSATQVKSWQDQSVAVETGANWQQAAA
jgi:hypothetical protein